jgi:diketogulonate reductase-like aldo/keto reductase
VVEVATVQNRCNLFDAQCFSNGVVELCEQRGIAFIAHSPVGGHQGHPRVANDPTLNAIARRHDSTPQQIALAWLLARSPSLLAIPGATRSASVEGSARAAEIRLTAADLADVERAFPTPSPLLQRLVRVRTRVRHAVRTVKTFARRS